MKKLVQTIEVEGQGLEAFLGEELVIFCANYFYFGKLTGVNTHDILLENAYIVYETGDFSKGHKFSDMQFISKEWRVRTAFIESYGRVEK